jgi:hypothetical protein
MPMYCADAEEMRPARAAMAKDVFMLKVLIEIVRDWRCMEMF